MLEKILVDQPPMKTLGQRLEAEVQKKPDITAIVAAEYPNYQPVQPPKKAIEKAIDSIYKAFTPVYDYISKKAKETYQVAARAAKEAVKQIRIKTNNGVRVLLRGWVRTYAVSSEIKISKTPYGKPCDPTREAFYSEFMSVLS